MAAQIFRPALLAGHSASGASNVDDLTAALLKGCIQMGAAPDLDWVFDAVPVDTAADAIVRLESVTATAVARDLSPSSPTAAALARMRPVGQFLRLSDAARALLDAGWSV